jgi:hypothetical protein
MTISRVTACDTCLYCHQSLYVRCRAEEDSLATSWIFGDLIDGRLSTSACPSPTIRDQLTDGVEGEVAVRLSDIRLASRAESRRSGKSSQAMSPL